MRRVAWTNVGGRMKSITITRAPQARLCVSVPLRES